MFLLRSDRLAGRPTRARASRVGMPAAAATVALVAAAAIGCSDSTTSPTPKATTCANYSCSVGASAAVGDTVLLNVRVDGGATSDDVGAGTATCGTPNLVKARVAAISNRAIVVLDTRNPANGLSDSYYASIGATFDTLVWPVDTRHFGAPTDIDHNGRVLIFYTRAVNGLTPANSDSYVGGFFYARDLFPTTSNAGFEGCTGSNAAEMFYLLAPDPNGTINGNKFDTAFVRRTTVGTAGHEFQHLISAARRLYVVNTNNYDEEVWLNEGMSHIAEELNFYQSGKLSPSGQPGQSPRANLTAASINSAGALVALSNLGFQNLARFSYYLAATESNSPYTDDDSLETRGATWSFLRYTFDRAGSTDSALTYPLVNSSNVGIANLRAVVAAQGGSSAGVPLETWFRDWSVANYADDLNAPASQYTQPSWDFRSVLTAFRLTNGGYFNNGVYPLTTRTLANGTAQTLTLTGGGAAYVLFSVPAGNTASLNVTGGGTAALPSTARLALVQTSGPNAGTVTTVDGTGSGAGAVSLPNTSGASIQAALVVFNAAIPATSSQAVTVTGTSIAAPATSLASSAAVSATRVAGPTRASASLASTQERFMSDAAVMRRLRAASRATLLPRAAGARALYAQARRSGDFSAWSRQAYVAGSVKGLTVPVGVGTPGAVTH